MNLYRSFLDWAGIGDIKQRHRAWRHQQIALEIEEAQMECARLAAWIGQLKREKTELEQEMNRAD